ncbi:MAG: SufS family cysteine desulfurase [Bacteroidales bacterium]|nr:SufS family cysteine desulfurase [Bacteroidales bacterium]
MKVAQFRKLFPILGDSVPGGKLVYLDNAATSQRPQAVVDAYSSSALHKNANLHRAVHHLSNIATNNYEIARDFVREYLNAASREEIIFTSGATAAINTAAFSFGEAYIKPGDEIIVTEAEHHSNIVPWQMMASRKGATIKVLPVDDNGHLRLDLLPGLLGSNTKILAVAHISNVLGLVNPLPEIIRIAHANGTKVLVDGAQGIVHKKVDVQALGCDFYVFSGHKMFAAPFTGVLYGKKELLAAMPPMMGGGEMIETVSLYKGTTYAPLPAKFEAGTQNISGVPTFIPAIETLRMALDDEELRDNSKAVAEYVASELAKDSRIRVYGSECPGEEKIPLFSFTVQGAHHEDLALILDKMGIAVRSGQMCAEPLMDRFGVTGMLRASFAPYNTMEEAEMFIKSLSRAIGMLV